MLCCMDRKLNKECFQGYMLRWIVEKLSDRLACHHHPSDIMSIFISAGQMVTSRRLGGHFGQCTDKRYIGVGQAFYGANRRMRNPIIVPLGRTKLPRHWPCYETALHIEFRSADHHFLPLTQSVNVFQSKVQC